MTISENLKEWIKDISISLIIVVLFLQFIQPTIVKEHSMEGTLSENDYLFVSKKAYKLFGSPKRGDIIVFDSEFELVSGKTKQLIKRIIGLPGDTVAIHNGSVILNGHAIEEAYIKDGYTSTEMDELTVPEGSLFVMGDNRQSSADSRDSRIGCVELSKVTGKAIIRLFPFNRFGLLYNGIEPSIYE